MLICFHGGAEGAWNVRATSCLAGEPIAIATRLEVTGGPGMPPHTSLWSLRGVVSNLRYANRGEHTALQAAQAPLDRPAAKHAALIPIRKSSAWWSLAQDERRDILEEQSRHIAIGREYLPAIARRLHHSRDLGEPFDFLTWFEYAPADEPAFDEMLERLRASPEWRFVDREIDIRLSRAA